MHQKLKIGSHQQQQGNAQGSKQFNNCNPQIKTIQILRTITVRFEHTTALTHSYGTQNLGLSKPSAHLLGCLETYTRLPNTCPGKVEGLPHHPKKTKGFEACRPGHAAVQKNLLKERKEKEYEENSRK